MSTEARQRVAFRPGTRIGVIAASLAAAAALALPSTALASTEIGSAQSNYVCSYTGYDTVQLTSMADGPTFAVPAGGTLITSWSAQGGTEPNAVGPVGLEVWRPTTPLGSFRLVGSTPTTTLKAGMNTFPLVGSSQIGVQAGDLIGLRIEGPVPCVFQTNDQTDRFTFVQETAPTQDEVVAMDPIGVPSFELNIAVSVDVAANWVPTSTDQCKGRGWQTLTDSAGTSFKNQGDCVSFVATGETNTAAGS